MQQIVKSQHLLSTQKDLQAKRPHDRYDAAGNITTVTDANGNVGYFYYDTANRMTHSINPEGAVTEQRYDALGNITETIRYANKTSGATETTLPAILADSTQDQRQVVSYDAASRQSTIQTYWGASANDYYTESFTYDAQGNVLTSTARNGATTTYTYDAVGRKATETLPVTSKDSNGSSIAVVNSFSYDAMGNLTAKTEAVGLPEERTTNYTYTLNNLIATESIQVYLSDDQSNVTATKGMTYDARGNVTSETDANGNSSYYYYDSLDRQVAMVDANGVMTAYQYDAVGNKVSQTVYANKVSNPTVATQSTPTVDAANDRTTLYTYDGVGRVLTSTIADMVVGTVDNSTNLYNNLGTQSLTQATRYDANGNIVEITDANSNSTYAYYNNAGEKVAEVDAAGYLTTWTRDAFGNVAIEIKYAANLSTVGLTNINDNTTLAQIQTAATTLGTAGSATVTGDRVTTYQYDKLSRLAVETKQGVTQGTVNASNGQLSEVTAAATTTYQYDGLNNLTQKTDALNNISNLSYDGMGRLIQQQDPTFTDDTGNTTARTTTNMEYDGLGNVARLIARGTDNNSEADDQITTYTYSTGGRLASEADALGVVTSYAYDLHGNLIQTTLENRRTADQIINNQTGTDDVTTYTYDNVNRQLTSTDINTGIVNAVTYNSFGEVIAKSTYEGAAPTNPDEFVEYDRAGRIFRTNSEDGIVKVMIYDANGNVTMRITSTDSATANINAVQNTQTDLTAFLAAANTLRTMSVYDDRNQLTKTIQATMDANRQLGSIVTNSNSTDISGDTTNPLTSSVLETQEVNPVNMGDVSISNVNYDLYLNVDGTDNFILAFNKLNSGNGDTYKVKFTTSTGYSAEAYIVEQDVSGQPTYNPNIISQTIVMGPFSTYKVRMSYLNGFSTTDSSPTNYPSYSYLGKSFFKLSTEFGTPLNNSNIKVYKVTSQGEVLFIEHNLPANGIPFGTPFQSDLGAKLFINNQPSTVENLLLSYRPAGSAGAYEVASLSRVVNAVGSVITGMYSFDYNSIAAGNYEFSYVALDANGNILNQQSGTFNTTNASAPTVSAQTGIPIGGLGRAFISDAASTGLTVNGLQLVNQGNTADSVTMRYRVKGSGGAWSTINNSQFVKSAANAGYGLGHFSLATADMAVFANNTTYEVELEVYDSNGALLRITSTEIARDASGNFNADLSLSLNKLRLGGEPVEAAYMDIAYRTQGGSSAYSTPVRIYATATGSGAFDWDITGIPLGNQDVDILSYDSNGNVLNHYQAYIDFGENSAVVNNLASLNKPRFITINPPQPETVDYVIAGYRPAGSYSDYTLLPISVGTINATTGQKEFNVEIPLLDQGDYEYQYTAYSTDTNNYVDPQSITIIPPSNTQAGTAPTPTPSPTPTPTPTPTPSPSVLYTEDFNGASAPVNIWGNASGNLDIVDAGTTNGRISIKSAPVASNNWPGFASNDTFTYSAGQVLRAEMHFGALSTGRDFTFSMSGEDTNGNGITHRLQISGGSFNAGYNDSIAGWTGSWAGGTNGGPSSIDPNTTYIVEFETAASSTTLYVYKQGETRVDGWSHTQTHNVTWSTFQYRGQVAETPSGQGLTDDSIDNITLVDTTVTSTPSPTPTPTPSPTPTAIQAKYALAVDLPVGYVEGDPLPEPSWITTTATAITQADGSIQYLLDIPSNLAEGDYVYEYQTYSLVTDINDPNYDTYQWTDPIQGGFKSTVKQNEISTDLGAFTIDADSIDNTQTNWVWNNPSATTATISREQTYNAFGEIASEINHRDANNIFTTTYTYNALGNLTRKQDPTVSITTETGQVQDVAPVTTYSYDAIGRMLSVTDANGNTNSQTWIGNSTQLIDTEYHADGGQIEREYNTFGNLTSYTDAIDRTTTYSYDKNNQLVELRRPSVTTDTNGNVTGGAVDRYIYDEAGNRVAHTNALGNTAGAANATSKTDYDSLGRVTGTRTNLGHATTYTYTYNPNVAGLGGATMSGWTTTTKDAVGRTIIDTTDMFGRTYSHKDLGNHLFIYNYNEAGWLTSQTGSTGQNIVYDHYNNGYIKSIHDKALGMYTYYEYDGSGNKSFEGYVSLKNNDDIDAGFYNNFQQATITYDALNRMTSVADPKASITYTYDAVGNRRSVRSEYRNGVDGALDVQEYWYQYDSMNRFLITKGTFNSNTNSITIGAEGNAITYDAAGQRKQAINGVTGTLEDYSYNADGYLTDIHINGVLRARRTNDLLGRTTNITEYASNGSTVTYTQSTNYDADNRVLSQSGTGGTTTYYYYDNANNNSHSQNGAGELARTRNVNGPSITNSYYNYEYWDEAKVRRITADPYNATLKGANNVWRNGYSDVYYDVNGHISHAIDRAGNRNIRYVSDAQGVLLVRDEITGTIARPNFKYGYVQNTYTPGSIANKVERFYYVDGVAVGGVGNDGPSRVDYVQAMANRNKPTGNYANWRPVASADFDQNYEPISPTYPGPVASSYTVKAGDTLQSIALTVWGDADMWYLIADANGLISGQELEPNMELIIPNKVTNIHNNAGTYRPYNPGEAIGDLNPTIPAAPLPKPKKKGCGGIGAIIAAVVSVAVTVITGNPVLGNIAGQVVGMATGAQKGFNFTSLAMSAIVPKSGFVNIKNEVLNAAANAAISNAASQGIGIIIGEQKGFSWSSIAASAVGGAVGQAVGGKLGVEVKNGAANLGQAVTKNVVSGIAGNVASQLTQVALVGGKFSWTSVAVSGIHGVGSGFAEKRAIDLQNAQRAAIGNNNAVYEANLREANKPVYGSIFNTPATSGGLATNYVNSARDVDVTFTPDQFASQAEYNSYIARNGGLTSNIVDSHTDVGVAFTANQIQKNNNAETIAAYFGTGKKDAVKLQAEGRNLDNEFDELVKLADKFKRTYRLEENEKPKPIVKTLEHTKDSSGFSTIAEYGQIVVDDGVNALGKSKGAVVLNRAKPLHNELTKSIMLSDDLRSAQDLIKSPNAKSAVAMAEFATKNKVLLKGVPLLGDGLTVIEEGSRMLKADSAEQRAKLGAVATFNYVGDKAVTGLGATQGAYAGATLGAFTGPLSPVAVPVLAVVGGVSGAVFAHWSYSKVAAENLRATFVGEQFRD
ncbi:MAG: LysM peptidoglycan-binding domain-containing protein [Methylotenera sp.]